MDKRNGAITLSFDAYEVENICNLLKHALWKEESNGEFVLNDEGLKVYGKYGPLRKPTKRYRQLQFTLNSIKRQMGSEQTQ